MNYEKINQKLREYCDRYESQNKAAASIKGASSATISQILNYKWDLITDEMWRNIASQIDYKDDEWQAEETRDFRIMNAMLADAQQNSLVLAITGAAGTGKTFAAKTYASSNRRVYMLSCNEYWNRRLFLSELLMAMGRDFTGNAGEMMQEIVRNLKKQDRPLLILDEADKLTDAVLYFFITLYNQLDDECGIILLATNFLEKRLKRGVKLNRKGYNEIWSRVGRKCIALKGVSANDIAAICKKNGIESRKDIDAIIQDSESDLRRVRRRIHATKKQAA